MTRIGVAIGEAGCSPAAYSILSDYFDRHQRARAIAIYTLGIPVGTLAAAAGGGWLTQNHGWRSAFLVAAVLGLIVSASLFVVVREPARGQRDGEAQRAGASVKTIFGKLLASPFHRRTMAAITLMSCVSSGVTVWIPSFLLREKGMQMQDIMHYYGLGSAIAIGAGMLWSGWLADRLRARRPAGQLLVPSAMMAIGVVPLTAAIIVPGWQAALVLFSICLFCFGCYLSPSVSAIQERVPAAERSTAISIYIVIYSLLGSATGPLIVGGLSDLFAQQAKGSSLAAGLFVMAMLSVATSIMYWAAANSERPSPVRS